MEDDRRERIALLVKLQMGLDQEMTTRRQEIYLEGLRDLSLEELSWAVDEAIKNCEFLPKVKNLRVFAEGIPRRLRKVVRAPDVPLKLEVLTPPEEARKKLAELAGRFNCEMGTSFIVGEDLGRPVLVSIRGGKG